MVEFIFLWIVCPILIWVLQRFALPPAAQWWDDLWIADKPGLHQERLYHLRRK